MIGRDLPAGPGVVARMRFTDRAHGDFRVDGAPAELTAARNAIVDSPWTWLRQVHGNRVVAVGRAGEAAGTEADASITTTVAAPLSVQTADCAAVVMVAGGCVAVAHAGWRGLVEGVLSATVAEVRARTTEPISAVLGPCIRPAGYEFGLDDLERVERVAGLSARGRTSTGRPALDLPAAVAAVLTGLDVVSVEDLELDTCDPRFYSHRTRSEQGRQAAVVWLEAI